MGFFVLIFKAQFDFQFLSLVCVMYYAKFC